MSEIIAFCGLKCHECEAYIATKANSKEEIEKIAKKWSTQEHPFAPEDMWCDGCTGDGERIFSWCKECPIRNCCLGKQVSDCIHCEDFICEIIEKDPSGAKERLIALKEAV